MTAEQTFLAAMGVLLVHSLFCLMHRASGGRS